MLSTLGPIWCWIGMLACVGAAALSLPPADATPINTTLSAREPQPAGFKISASYKSAGQAIQKNACMFALIGCLAQIAFYPWESQQNRIIYRSRPQAALMIRPSLTENMLTKHAVWSLQNLFYWWADDMGGHYAETTWITKLGEKMLGFGAVTFQDLKVPGVGNGSGDEGGVNGTMNDTAHALTAEDTVYLDLTMFKEDESILRLSDFYSLVVDALVTLAQFPSDASIHGQKVQDPKNKVMLEWGPTSEAAYREGRFSASMGIQAMDHIARVMEEQPVGRKCRSFTAKVKMRVGGAIVGRINFFRTDDPEWRPTRPNTMALVGNSSVVEMS